MFAKDHPADHVETPAEAAEAADRLAVTASASDTVETTDLTDAPEPATPATPAETPEEFAERKAAQAARAKAGRLMPHTVIEAAITTSCERHGWNLGGVDVALMAADVHRALLDAAVKPHDAA